MLKIVAPQTGIVYGPMESRRFGRSLGINLLPAGRKLCNFNCRYCQYGGHGYPDFIEFPSVSRIDEEVGYSLERLARRGTEINWITLSGNGEPTLHPQFDQVVDVLIRLRNRWYPNTPIGILTNGSTCHRPSIRLSLKKLDGRFVKLDAGSEKVFHDVNSPRSAVTWEKWLSGVQHLKEITLQSCFYDGPHGNAYDEAVSSWIEAAKSLAPQAIQIYTVDRMPFDSSVWPCDRDTLLHIARLAREAVGVPVSVCLPEESEAVFPEQLHRLF